MWQRNVREKIPFAKMKWNKSEETQKKKRRKTCNKIKSECAWCTGELTNAVAYNANRWNSTDYNLQEKIKGERKSCARFSMGHGQPTTILHHHTHTQLMLQFQNILASPRRHPVFYFARTLSFYRIISISATFLRLVAHLSVFNMVANIFNYTHWTAINYVAMQ